MHWYYKENDKIVINLDAFETHHNVSDLWLPRTDRPKPNHKIYNIVQPIPDTDQQILIRKDLYNFLENNNLIIKDNPDYFIICGIQSEQICLLFELKFA